MDSDLHLDTHLPTYDMELSQLSPTYSEHPGASEIILHPEPFAPEISSSTQHWVCETKHMKIDLGPHIWGLSSPSYGLNGTVIGSVKFLEQRQNVEAVTVSFEGRLTTFRPYRGTSSDTTSCIISRTFPLYVSCCGSTFNWDEEHTFSIPIPNEINTPGGGTAPTPPSYNCYFYGSAMEVAYSIKIDMVHKGSNMMRKHETKVIPVYYLPKSQPSEPPLSVIPRPSRLSEETDVYLHWLDRVHTIPVVPSWANSKCKLELASFAQSVFFSIPHPLQYCSGEDIPFAISFVFPTDPALAKLLTRCIRVILLKRITFGTKKKGFSGAKGDDPDSLQHNEWVLTSGTLKYQNEFAEGVRLLRGYIRAGGCGKETSWSVDSIGVQYVLRVAVTPPKPLADHIPNFQSELVVDVTTDHWGPLPHREHCAINGIPTPATGLASDPQANWIGNTAYAVI
ncbi:hypothetical protein CPB85DRAFT_1429719 [Mucidula mucida]|nr:hypothetical protein CPB85DRAFT_1429719 [Mucidula mucida]